MQGRELPPALDIPFGIRTELSEMIYTRLRGVFTDYSHDKISRDNASFGIRDQAITKLRGIYPQTELSVFYECYNQICRDLLTELALDSQKRVDGRRFDQMRPISCEASLHKPLHGSATFQRGQTQVFCTVTLDSLESALKTDPMSIVTGGLKEKNFFVHYEFPPYATNEIGRTGIGRRELGHGALAEKGLRAVIPKDYPFTIRLTSEVLESNGKNSEICSYVFSYNLFFFKVPRRWRRYAAEL